jgi:hypothetical protein
MNPAHQAANYRMFGFVIGIARLVIALMSFPAGTKSWTLALWCRCCESSPIYRPHRYPFLPKFLGLVRPRGIALADFVFAECSEP